jgi:hypothetical protein
VTEPESLVLQILREMRAEMATKSDIAALRSEMRSELADVRSEMKSGFANVASDLLDLEKRLNEQTKVLRRSVFELHSNVIGHGILYGELEERIRRIEARLDAAPGAH